MSLVAIAPTPAEATAVHHVAVQDNFFAPDILVVSLGDTVRWTWTGTRMHTVSGGLFSSGTHSNGHVFEHTFDLPGVFPYYCQIHGAAMRGVVVVGPPASG